jgi:hypothetical protein
VLTAQSATIDGVSGATFTSEAYAQSRASPAGAVAAPWPLMRRSAQS